MPLGPPHGQRCRGRVWRGGLWVLPQLLWKRPLAAWVPPFGCKSRLLPHGVCPWDTRGGRCRAPMPGQRGVGGLWPQALLQLRRFLASCSIPPLQRWPQLLHLALLGSPTASSWLSGMGLGQFRPPPLAPSSSSAGGGWQEKDTASRRLCWQPWSRAAPWCWGRAPGMLSSCLGFAGGAGPGPNPAAPRVWGRSLAPLSLAQIPLGGPNSVLPIAEAGGDAVAALQPRGYPEPPSSSQLPGGSRGPEGARGVRLGTGGGDFGRCFPPWL